MRRILIVSAFAVLLAAGALASPIFHLQAGLGLMESMAAFFGLQGNTAISEPASIILLSAALLGCTTVMRRNRLHRQPSDPS